MEAIRFDHVWFRYNKESKAILKDINVTFEYSNFIVIKGNSGSGKSTLMSLINGEIPNYTKGDIVGDIFINGKSNKGKTIGEISLEVGSVLQNADEQIVHDIVEDEIAFGCENLGKNKDEIKKSIDDATKVMKLDKDAKTRKLSGGQKQRLITSSSIAMGQKIIILDEPLANLDQKGAKIILDELKRRVDFLGYLVIIIEHRTELLKKYATKVYELKDGSLIETNNYSEVSEELEYIENKNIKESNILEVKNLNKSFYKKPLLKDISFNIKEGERVLILGENGCGKTTLTKILSKILKFDSGTITSNILPKRKRKWFKEVGYIFQNPNYQLFMPTVKKEIEFSAKDPELTNYLIDNLDLNEILLRHPFSLSEGQKRKVAVAAICAMKPKLLFLDEPTVGQDIASLDKIVSSCNYLNLNYNTTIISVSHDKRCAKVLADKVIWIKDGMIYKIGDNSLVDIYFEEVYKNV